MEFTDPIFFTSYNQPEVEQEESFSEPSLEHKISNNSHSTTIFAEESLSHSSGTASSRRVFASKASENHNMVKQLIITMRQMMGKYIHDVGCNYNSRQIISAVWKVFETTKTPNKDILRAMFDREVNKKLIEKVDLSSIVNQYGTYEFLNAMEELRADLLLRMRSENLKTHLFNRSISKKERLTAYIQYFVEDELRGGKISSRFSEAANKRMA